MRHRFLFLPMVAAALLPAAVPADSQSCVSLDDDRARLACYDAAHGREAGARPATPVPPASTASAATAAAATPAVAAAAAPGPTKPAAQPVDDFGLGEQARLERSGVEATTSIAARVTGVNRRADDRQLFTLDNGQTWVQVDAGTRVRLQAGDAVTIRRAAMGSYLLNLPGTGSMRVRRQD